MPEDEEVRPEVKVEFDPETDLDLYPQGECGLFSSHDVVVYFHDNDESVLIPAGETFTPKNEARCKFELVWGTI